MQGYNLTKKADRAQLRQDLEAELTAVQTGAWPRNLNDAMAYHPPRNVPPAEWAKRVCEHELVYLEGVETRLATDDPALEGWEK